MKKSSEINPETTMTEVVEAQTAEIEDKAEKREEKFVYYLQLGLSPYQAALKAGFSRSYAKSGIYQRLRKSESLQKKIMGIAPKLAQTYRRFCQAVLPEIQQIESNALVQYEKDPRLAIEKPALLKQIKQAGGVLNADFESEPSVVNIRQVQILLQEVGRRRFGGGVIDVDDFEALPEGQESEPGEE